MGIHISNTMMMRNVAMACVFFAVVVTAVPGDAIVPETELYLEPAQLHKGASDDITALMEAGKTKDACATLADSSIKEIKDGAKNTQKLLNKMDVGKNCHTAGLSAYNAAKNREKNAKNAYNSANTAYQKAKNARINFSGVALSQIKSNGCYNVASHSAYTSAKAKLDRANKNVIKKKAAYNTAKKTTADALKAHQKAKKACACRAQKNHKAAVKSTSNFNSAKNAKAWTKAYHMKCVLDGKPANKCAVPRVPRVTTPRMPSWVSRTTGCDAEEKERKAKERNNKHNERKNKEAHRERVNKHNERKNKEAHRE